MSHWVKDWTNLELLYGHSKHIKTNSDIGGRHCDCTASEILDGTSQQVDTGIAGDKICVYLCYRTDR